MSLDIRLEGAIAALDRVHPLCNPYLHGPVESKNEWLLGYGFAIKLPEIERVRLRLAILERGGAPRTGAPT